MGIKNVESTKEILAVENLDTMPEVEGVLELGEGLEDFDSEILKFAYEDSSEKGDSVLTEDANGVVKVKYNKKKLRFTVDEAVPFVEMGLKWNSFKEEYKKLALLSNLNNYSVRELIDRLVHSSKALLFESTLKQFGGDENSARQAFYQMLNENLSVENGFNKDEVSLQRGGIKKRLMDEFKELNEMFSGKFKTFNQVPLPVVEDAINRNRSLIDSYLRFSFSELGSIKKTLDKQKEIKNQSAGSLKSKQGEAAELGSFEKAFRKAFK